MTLRTKVIFGSTIAAIAVAGIFLARGRGTTGNMYARAGAKADAVNIQTTQSATSAVMTVATEMVQIPTSRGTLPYTLSGTAPFDKPLRLAVEALGAKVVSLQSRNTLLVEANAATRARLASDRRFEKIEEVKPSDKIQPELAALVNGGAKEVDISIVAIAATDREAILAMLAKNGGEPLKGCINEGDTIRARIPSASVVALAAHGEVCWMEHFTRPQFMNDIAVNTPQMNVREVWDAHGLTGAGQNISTSDTGIDTGDRATLHEDLRNQVQDIQVVPGCNKTDSNGHGTHTAGSIVGNGTKSGGKIKGPAYKANLYAWFCCGADGFVYTPDSMAELYRNNDTWDACIHSASWGRSINGKYDAGCAQHDKYVWENPEFLPVFSAGNDGDYGETTIGAPGSCKNVLTVGATQNARTDHDGGWGNGNPQKTATFSSRGPCKDGRIKPDIAAPGVGILSTRSHGVNYSYGNYDEFYAYDSGTSMSCPLTAGAVALVRQWLIEKKGFADEKGKRPTAALMKAVITGGAKDRSKPDNNQGWGRVDLEETLFPSNRAVKLIDRIPFASGFTTNIIIETTNAAPLDVQLVWVDYPGSASAGQSVPRLVNDLDLVIESVAADGQISTCYGNGGNEPDTLNNVESVRIANAPVTKYVITVNCKTILHDYTEGGAAALYIRGAFDPAATPSAPGNVRLKNIDQRYLSLDRAIEAIHDDGETIEILDQVGLGKSVTLTNSCTLLATDANPMASTVIRANGAVLNVAQGATLTIDNFAFANSATQPAISVADGSCLKITGKLGLGTVKIADKNGLNLCGAFEPIGAGIEVDFLSASAINDVFGTWSCDYPTASESARRIYNARDPDLGGSAVSDDGTLKWIVAEVPLSDAKCVVSTSEGKKGYRSFQAAIKAAGNADGTITIKQGVTHTNALFITRNLTLSATDGASLSLTDDAAFIMTNDTKLIISNLVINGAGAKIKDAAFKVNGGELLLAKGAVLTGITNRYNIAKSYGGTIAVLNGRVTMTSGARIENCASQTRGGAIYLQGENASADLFGGTIVGCNALNSLGGGAVYSCFGSSVNIQGDFSAIRNTAGSATRAVKNNLYLSRDTVFTLTDKLTGSVGVSFGKKNGLTDLNQEGIDFIVVSSGLSADDIRYSAKRISHDKDDTLFGSAKTTHIAWTKFVDDGQCDPAVANCVVTVAGEQRYYSDLNTLFAFVDADMTIQLKDDELITQDLTVRHSINLTSSNPTAPACIWRTGDAMIRVEANGQLVIANLILTGRSSTLVTDSTVGLISVNGGSLTLENGAEINSVFGSDSRAANAISIWNGGTLTMKSGSKISESQNSFHDPVNNTSCGGGVLLDRSIAYFEGGTITKCQAARAGGVYLANNSKGYVSGDFTASDNVDLNNAVNNFVISKNSNLYLKTPFTGSVGINEGLSCDTNRFATVENYRSWNIDTLKASAARFFHDVTGDHGVVVTNATDTSAILVWNEWVSSRSGKYTDADGNVYRICLTPGQTLATPRAFSVGTSTLNNGSVKLAIEGGVAGCWYTVYATDSLAKPFTPIKSVQLDSNETYCFEIESDKAAQFYKVVAEEGIR